MQVAVVGAGAVGCYYGGLLLRAGHDVTFIGRQPHVDAINAHGLLLDTKTFNGHLPAKAATDATALASPDLVLVCVKSADTEQAGRSLAGRLLPETSVLSLQNGVDNAPRLAAVTGHAVIPVVVYVGSEMAGPGHVRHHGGGDLAIGPSAASEALAQTLAGRRHRHHDRRRHRQDAMEQADHQLRLQRAFRGGRHFLRTDAGSRRYQGCRHKRGAGSDSRRPCLRRIDRAKISSTHILKIPTIMPNQMSSTAQDLARGKPSEIDFLNGYVVRKGAELGIATPTNQALQVMVKLAQRGKEMSGVRKVDIAGLQARTG